MKYLKEFAVILGITLAGEWLNHVLPLPVPAGVYGLFLMLLLFCTKTLKLEQVEAAGNFLLDIMPVLFVPAAVGLMDSYGQLKEVLVPVFLICLISTVVVMAVTGKVAEGMMKLQGKKEVTLKSVPECSKSTNKKEETLKSVPECSKSTNKKEVTLRSVPECSKSTNRKEETLKSVPECSNSMNKKEVTK